MFVHKSKPRTSQQSNESGCPVRLNGTAGQPYPDTMKFIVRYQGPLPAWTREYTELETIEIFFKKYFEEMLVDEQTTRIVDVFVFEIRG